MDLIAELAKADVAITGATPALRRADRADVLLEVRLLTSAKLVRSSATGVDRFDCLAEFLG